MRGETRRMILLLTVALPRSRRDAVGVSFRDLDRGIRATGVDDDDVVDPSY